MIGQQKPHRQEIDLVAAALSEAGKANRTGLTARDLRAKANPKGDGIFVYVPMNNRKCGGLHIFWIVLDGQAYPLNGSTRAYTPQLEPASHEMMRTQAGMGGNFTLKAMQVVFGETGVRKS